ncbi:hypothetical protein MJO28_001835 [Puccinia striiformis f. sp. tritici]|uniref:Uncharacterized protein n=1 Tax=Puccinia striiformis f. sp. tritici TaxID=168172 RepID=A0ACC0EV37_9BASI|nr:hypothetical protein MJO28_001835 [Puccinia striiformis f. sp. tritici]
MAAEEPPDHVPSTPPHTSNDPPDVSQSSRCESSCLRTPISHPGFIATQSDSRGALPLRATQPRQRPMIPNRDTFPAEETSNNILEVPDSNTDSSWPRRAAKANQAKSLKSLNVRAAKSRAILLRTLTTRTGPNQKLASDAYACRWCDKEVKATKQSKYNLKAHRDGADYKSTHKKPCAGRAKAIQSGCSLPPTPAELTAAKAQSTPNNSGTIVAYTTRGRFDNSTLTKILIIWLIRQSLLWLRMEDFHLRLAFDHAIVSSQLPSRVWAAAHAHQLYLEQRSQVIKLIKASESNVSLISDIWTTKGSHKAFVGITICYINKQWKYDKSGIGFALLKINYICRRIASNPQKQAEWKLWAGKLGYTGRGVIGGFGIRWNIAYDSRQRAYEGRRVIKQLLENKSDKCGGQSVAKHFFNSYELSSREWEDANSLNQVLKEFLEMTNRLEGDGPLLPMVLYEYFRLLDSLEKKKRAAESTALEQMFYPMIVITNKYLNLAVTCDTLTSLKSRIFGERDELLKLLQPNPTPPEGTQSELNASPNDSDSDGDAFNYYPTNGDTIEVNTELEHYNNDFPVMASLARDYLACAASSASVERTFLAAAGVCATGQASLAIQTIQRCISSHMWLRDSVEVGGLFADCQASIDAGLKNPKFKRYLVKPVTYVNK